MPKKIILASQSPRRQELLKQLGLTFEVCSANIDEHFSEDLPIEKVAEFLAKQKAEVVAGQHPQGLIIAADTVVILDKKILGKPSDLKEAREMLESLSGKKHQVISGVCVLDAEQCFSFSSVTQVEFIELEAAQIEYYINHFEVLDKAGAYAIQEWIGMVGIRKIEGDFYNVMGLPLVNLNQVLSQEFGKSVLTSR